MRSKLQNINRAQFLQFLFGKTKQQKQIGRTKRTVMEDTNLKNS